MVAHRSATPHRGVGCGPTGGVESGCGVRTPWLCCTSGGSCSSVHFPRRTAAQIGYMCKEEKQSLFGNKISLVTYSSTWSFVWAQEGEGLQVWVGAGTYICQDKSSASHSTGKGLAISSREGLA